MGRSSKLLRNKKIKMNIIKRLLIWIDSKWSQFKKKKYEKEVIKLKEKFSTLSTTEQRKTIKEIEDTIEEYSKIQRFGVASSDENSKLQNYSDESCYCEEIVESTIDTKQLEYYNSKFEQASREKYKKIFLLESLIYLATPEIKEEMRIKNLEKEIDNKNLLLKDGIDFDNMESSKTDYDDISNYMNMRSQIEETYNEQEI